MTQSGVHQLYFEDVEVGNPLPPLETGVVTQTNSIRFEAATGVFAPAHHDLEFARQIGLPRTILPGNYSFSYIARMLTDWIGPEGWLAELDVRFRDVGLTGHRFSAEGVVTRKYVADERYWVACDVWFRDFDRDSKVTAGTCLVHLPSTAVGKEGSPWQSRRETA
ncbi:MAG: hypothetical protein EPO21_17185 [Chloroflexota bacterium]|nr:MAG: hypothetical protein EPO21_17185 [Chloroflexota bacterium]